MAGLITIIFWILAIPGFYIGIKYSQSRNKKLFFKAGAYRAFLISLLILVIGGLMYFILPQEPTNLGYLRLHSESLTKEMSHATGLTKYWLKSLEIFTEMNLIGFVSAALVTAIWIFYIRNLDFFSKEKLKFTILGFVLGILSTFFTFPLSDIVTTIFSIVYSSNTFYNLFVYSFLGIGIVEELIKIVPVLIILVFTKEIDEPIDLIYYASVSALGFAFIENLLYFREISGSIVIGRALTSAVGHMIDSSFVVYGIILWKFRREKFRVVIYYFFLGAFAHALYDYFLFEELTLLFYAAFAFFIQAWVIMINNAINNSKYFDYSIDYKHNLVKYRLAIFLTTLLVASFLLNGLVEGRLDALNSYLRSLVWSGLLIMFYVGYASSFDLFKGYWRPVKFRFSSPSNQAMPGMRGYSSLTSIFTENTIVPLNHVGKRIKLHSPPYNQYLCEIFHIGEGRIETRIELTTEKGEDPDWFVIKLDTPLNVDSSYKSSEIIIKIRNKHSSLVHDEHIKCWLKLVPEGVDQYKEKDSSKYTSYGFIMINGEDYVYEQ